ncbi:MAG: GldG family protein [Verrucomicrobiae bacterium]|nr:GldG family protein [Verrucomicrobiae bacterium]
MHRTKRAAAKGPSRTVIGSNVAVSLALACLLAGMLNYLSFRHYETFDLSATGSFTLSDKTRHLLRSLESPVRISMIFSADSVGYTEVKGLLERYRDEGSGRVRLEVVDRFVERARAEALAAEFRLASEQDVVVVRAGEDHRAIPASEMVQPDTGPPFGDRIGSFHVEDRVTSAIASLVSGRRKKIYFTTGHGEADVSSKEDGGLSQLGDNIGRDNADVASLNLLIQQQVPQDADVLVIVGPRSPFQPQEIELLNGYISRGGNLLIMLDPGNPHGLGPLLERLGVIARDEVAVWPARVAGVPVLVQTVPAETYGDHPIVSRFNKVNLLFHNALSFARAPTTDKGGAKITELALSPASAWGEADGLSETARFDEGRDHRGPLCLAVAVDSGRVGNEKVDLAGARLVAIGCSSIFTNEGLRRSPVASDLARNAIGWMARQEQLIGIAPKQPRRYGYSLSVAQLATLGLLVGCVIPASVLLIGAAAWFHRRS